MALIPISGLLSALRTVRSWTSALFLIPFFIAKVLITSHPHELNCEAREVGADWGSWRDHG